MVALAQRMSDDLLRDEQRCFRAVDAALARHARPAAALLRRHWKVAKADPRAFAGDGQFRVALTGLHREALADGRRAVVDLLDRTVERALTSIGKELALCEGTLARRYEGVAAEGVARAGRLAAGYVRTDLRLYDQVAAAALAEFEAHSRRQVLLAAQYDEPLERVGKRLLSATALSVPGNGGRGSWWRTGSEMHRGARAASVALCNEVRTAAMDGMNEAGRGRG